MIFYNASTNQGICQEIDRLCDTTDTSYPRLDKTSRVNSALEELIGKIISADGAWEWDDTNQSDLPVATFNLTEAQESYSFASEYLKIKRMRIKDINSRWHLLKQIDQSDLEKRGITIDEYFGLTSSGTPFLGLPTHYDILGDSFRLYPAPTATYTTLTSGLKVDFVRTAVLFTAVATTVTDSTEPGLPSPYHVLLAYKASLPYAASYKKDRVNWLIGQIEKMERDLLNFYSRRNPNRRDILTMRGQSFR